VVLCVAPDEPRLPWTSSSGPSKCGVEHFLADLVALDAQRLLNTSHQARRAALIALAGRANSGLQLAQFRLGGHLRHCARIAQREQGEPPAHAPKFLRAQLTGLFGPGIPGWTPMGIDPEFAPAAPRFRNTCVFPRPSRAVSGIVFESSTAFIETPPDVANTVAKSAFRYIWRHLDTRQPDLGSGAARRGGSSPSSCTRLES